MKIKKFSISTIASLAVLALLLNGLAMAQVGATFAIASQYAVAGIHESLPTAIADSFRLPLDSWSIIQDFGVWNSTWGGYHLAQDALASIGTPVYAAGNGIIKFAGYVSGYYGVIIIEHTLPDQSKVCTLYGHIDTFRVNVGQAVNKGQIIGYVTNPSNYGYSGSPHLHFGIRRGGYTSQQFYYHLPNGTWYWAWAYVGYTRNANFNYGDTKLNYDVNHAQILGMWHHPYYFINQPGRKNPVYVTDSSPWFTRGIVNTTNSCRVGSWHSYTYQGHTYLWTYVGGMSSNKWDPDCRAEFVPYLSQTGTYDVYAYFYADPQNSRQVPFTVYYNGGHTTVLVDQWAPNYLTWREVKLGTWNFTKGEDARVVVTDATGETYDGNKTLNIDTIQWVLVGGETLYVSLSANPSSGTAPLNVNLTADVSGSASGTINYTFWWNCNDPGTSVSEVMARCGNIPTPALGTCASNENGIKCDAVTDDPKTVNHVYSSAGTYTAKVIAERGSAPPAEARVTIVVNAPPSGPPNDNRANATIVSVPSTWTQSTVGATTEAGEPAMCASWGATVWFRFTAPSSGMITVDTFGSNYDTVLAAYPLGSNTHLACNDDAAGGVQSQISFSVSANSVYELQVGGFGGQTGNLRLNVSSVTGYSISGRVVDISGNPIPGVTISDNTGHTTTTGSDGRYTLSGLVAGTYTITPNKSGYTFSPPSRTVTVPPDATGVDFTGSLLIYSISGRVMDSSGNPISGVTISDNAGHTTTTGSDGRYTLSGLAAGTYTITPSKSGYTFSPTSRTVTVPPDATGVDFTGSSTQKPWTFMLYLDGDDHSEYNLYPYLVSAILQLEAQPANPNVNVVVLFDGNQTNDSWRFLVQPGGNYTIGVNKWYMGELNMGDPQTLSDFIIWSREHYPAQHYYLAIAGHGRGTSGIAWDDTNSGDNLTPSELYTAFQVATNSGQWKIDVLHYDACLMAMLENAYQVKDYADYLVASENLGWGVFAYAYYVQDVQGQSAQGANTPYEFAALAARVTASTTPRQLAIDVANIFFNHPLIQSLPRTISVLDLSKTIQVRQAVDTFAIALSNNLSNIKAYIQNARSATQKFDSRDYFRITDDDEYLDLYHFAQRTKQYISNSDVQNAAQGVMDAINAGFVVAEHHQSGYYQSKPWGIVYWDLDNAHGVSIFFPPRSGSLDYNGYINHQLFRFTVDSMWDDLLKDYFGVIGLPPETPTTPPPPPMLRPEYKVFLPMVLRNYR